MVARTILITSFAALLVAACESSPDPEYRAEGEHGPDPISRDVSHTQGGSIHDPTSLSPPPVHRDYTEDR